MAKIEPTAYQFPISCLYDMEGVDGAEYRGIIERADVILGHDVMAQRDFLVYGKDFLQEVIRSGQTKAAMTVRVELDQETDELEWLIALIKVKRGKHDYPGGEED